MLGTVFLGAAMVLQCQALVQFPDDPMRGSVVIHWVTCGRSHDRSSARSACRDARLSCSKWLPRQVASPATRWSTGYSVKQFASSDIRLFGFTQGLRDAGSHSSSAPGSMCTRSCRRSEAVTATSKRPPTTSVSPRGSFERPLSTTRSSQKRLMRMPRLRRRSSRTSAPAGSASSAHSREAGARPPLLPGDRRAAPREESRRDRCARTRLGGRGGRTTA